MTDEQKDVPLRVRITRAEERQYRAAMAKLRLTRLSTYVRWALQNSTAQVLGVPAVAPAAPPLVAPAVAAQPAPKRSAPRKPRPAPATPPQPSSEGLLGIPLYAPTKDDPQPLDVVEDDSWV